ncbi:unnamed protein product [Sphagnum jensenii]|uniref:Protein TIC 100 n=1 Tax=Sphagnum jensenii TaxID=128206 RepID=A0ABP1B2G6_9BRYO
MAKEPQDDLDLELGDDEEDQQQRSVCNNLILSIRQVEWASDEEDEADDDADDDEDDEDEEEEEAGQVEGEAPKTEGDGASAVAKRQKARAKKKEEDENEEVVLEEEEEWNFPVDKDNWTEADLGEEWADPTPADDTVGRDPETAEDDEELIAKLKKDGRAPPRRPYYVPYRKWYPPIPEDHPDIDSPETVVEELERMEEFLVWASYVFEDGSSYEGTVFDDLAHGKGVYVTPLELCRYEGEWFQNMMEGHGVLEVDVPVTEPPPGSELARKWKEQGKILKSDYMNPEDKEWLRMDLEDIIANNPNAIDSNPFEDDELWVKYFGEKPEKGHYKYAGQWKHSRMHGCGVYELNGRQVWGKFYFGDLLPTVEECDHNTSAMHAGLAEVAAAKARMFVNKPDGMVRERKGPYTDPQHPYMYEEEDVWMAPGFINQYYKVPELWERYANEVDAEQEMWLNSFIKSPLVIPMPPELEYAWGKDREFLVLSGPAGDDKTGNPNERTEVLYHVPSGQIINWAKDPEGKMRFFIQPIVEDGSVIPELAIPLPLGMKEFFGEEGGDEDGKSDAPGGQKLTEKEKLQKKWAEEDAERKKRWDEEDAQRELEWAEKDKELELELEIVELDAKLQELAKTEELYSEIMSSKKPADTTEKASDDGEDGTLRTKKSEGETKPSDGADDDDDNENGGDEEDDDESPKPKSFGKVAMANPTEGARNSDNSTSQPFPTVFASLSLVPLASFQQVLSLAVGKAKKSWLPKTFATPSGSPPSAPPAATPSATPSEVSAKMGLCRTLESTPQSKPAPMSQICAVQFMIKRNSSMLRLRATAPKRLHPTIMKTGHHFRLHPNTASNAEGGSLPSQKSQRRKRQQRGGQTRSRLMTRPTVNSAVRQQSMKSWWFPPSIEILSLAVPLET